MSKKHIHVAVGVICNPQRQILVALRPNHVHQGGLWEFPGGKVESGETVHQALERELQEELAITPLTSRPLLEIHHDYSDKSVWLDVYWIEQFAGKARGCEGQKIKWVDVAELDPNHFPAANGPIIDVIKTEI